MSSKESRRTKTFKFLRHPGQAFRDVFRPPSPASSSSSAVQSNQRDPTPSTADSNATITQSLPIDKPTLGANVTASTAMMGQSSTRVPAPESTPTLEPSITEQLEKPDASALDNSTMNIKQSSFVPPSVIATGIPSSPDVVAHTPKPAQSPRPTPSGDQVKDTASAILKASLGALGKCVGVVPTFKSVVDILADYVDNIPAAVKNRKDYEALTEDITTTINSLQVHLNQVDPAHMSELITNVIGALTEEVNHVKEKQARTTARTYVEAKSDIDELVGCYRRLDALFRRLQHLENHQSKLGNSKREPGRESAICTEDGLS
ncbi:hypothetical protein FRC12_009423 [Ceratobasidium sp. 428]|nr:hypothetical protein FRC12_009423 [Ceratobasidium sp. 428]